MPPRNGLAADHVLEVHDAAVGQLHYWIILSALNAQGFFPHTTSSQDELPH